MINNKLRNGNFTSSEIVALTITGTREMTAEEMNEYKINNPKGKKKNIECWPGDKASTYINETNMERRLDRSLDTEMNSKPTSWGKLVEWLVFQLIGTAYILTSTDTVIHRIIAWWTGSPDGETDEAVMDIKAPFTHKSFCVLVDPLYYGLVGIDAMNAIRFGFTDKLGLEHKKHPDGEKYYWQLVSNACLRNKKFAELIIYMPYQSELPAIKLKALEETNNGNYYWLAMSQDDELPYLPDGGYYNNINTIRFEVPEEDKALLTKRVIEGGRLLIDNPAASKIDIIDGALIMDADFEEAAVQDQLKANEIL